MIITPFNKLEILQTDIPSEKRKEIIDSDFPPLLFPVSSVMFFEVSDPEKANLIFKQFVSNSIQAYPSLGNGLFFHENKSELVTYHSLVTDVSIKDFLLKLDESDIIIYSYYISVHSFDIVHD